MKFKVERIWKNNDSQSKFLGLANVKINDQFIIERIMLIEAPNGYIAAMPNMKRADQEHVDIVSIKSDEKREMLTNVIVNSFKNNFWEDGIKDEIYITNIKMYPVKNNEENVVAFFSIELNNCIDIHRVTLIQNGDDFIVKMPIKKSETSSINIITGMNPDLFEEIKRKVIDNFLKR